jgi:hypothetical protein
MSVASDAEGEMGFSQNAHKEISKSRNNVFFYSMVIDFKAQLSRTQQHARHQQS